ncbi:MAG: 2-C-methyl-D-erythritol 4-phosphate cytidylyltransferase [Mediterranea sp.]|jgi:2-C-methyl-D-erythritol 4-phosphate cytidylyltransferase|nr:2-C-methyl-D-erythritol 4-phosphate cytidylyltransferase [Mediterranea sp.]
MDKYAIIVAGGKGLRMGGDLPKQFLPLGGKPVLMRTLEVFRRYDAALRLIVVLPREQQPLWERLREEHRFEIGHLVTDGGETRFHSVRNGLALAKGPGLVGVHDGVRPFVDIDVIGRCYDEAAKHRAAVPVVEVVETLRHLRGDASQTVDRADYRMVQTPQVFDLDLLKRAYGQAYSPRFTDDASVVEALGEVPIRLVPGNRENIKITTPFDLKVGNTLL